MDKLGKHKEPTGASGLSGSANKVDEVVPWPGETLIIREKDTQLILTLLGGHLKLCPTAAARGGFEWDCTEQNGWLGFRNTISGQHISFDRDYGFTAVSYTLLSSNKFNARRHPEGGYILMAKDCEILRQMSLSPEKSLSWREKNETRWEFVRASDFQMNSASQPMQ